MKVYRARIGSSLLPLAYYLDASQPYVPAAERDSTQGSVTNGGDVNWSRIRLQGFTYFEALLNEKCFPIVASFLLAGVDPNYSQPDAVGAGGVHVAAKVGNTLAVNFLLDNGADVNARTKEGETPLMWAVRDGQIDTVTLLLSRGADATAVDSEGRSVVTYAASASPIALHALRNVVNLPQLAHQEHLLHHLCKMQGTRFTVLYCVEQLHCDVNQRDASSRTPLHWAATTGDIDLVKALCSKGADINAIDERGQRPFTQLSVPRTVRNFLAKYEMETTNSGKDRLTKVDFSNWSRLDVTQLKHFTVAFVVPNVLLFIGSWIGLFFGFVALAASAVGFTMVAQFGMRQKGRSMATAGWFLGALFFGGGVVVNRILPSYALERPETLVPTAWWLVTILMFYCYLRAVLADPGVVQSTVEGRRQIYEAVSEGESQLAIQGIDTSSMVRKPLRSKHCSKTGQCVYRFDHYCVWTGNAIGGGNHRYFVLYCFFQFLSQTLVAITTAAYLLVDAPARANVTAGVFSWPFVSFLYNSDNRLIMFLLVYYNTFVFMFVSTVVVTQMWYAARNVTSNEVWFADRYKWMFKLGSRAYCMFDQGWRRNLADFFWTSDLCAEIHNVPPMNDHLKRICQRYAARAKSRQQTAHPHHADPYQPHAASTLADSVAGTAAVPTASLPAGGGGGHFDYAAAVAQLPREIQNEMQVVQSIVQAMIRQGSTEGIDVPPGVAQDRREHLLHQAKTMFHHFQHALSATNRAPLLTEEPVSSQLLEGHPQQDSSTVAVDISSRPTLRNSRKDD
mmetsp:Transcript_20065/g.23109  ORF Transcript_20065/g.23109 Transcript_20065/m.23109 type:complete len:791 (-) Transcript_20065:122-2494(-)